MQNKIGIYHAYMCIWQSSYVDSYPYLDFHVRCYFLLIFFKSYQDSFCLHVFLIKKTVHLKKFETINQEIRNEIVIDI